MPVGAGPFCFLRAHPTVAAASPRPRSLRAVTAPTTKSHSRRTCGPLSVWTQSSLISSSSGHGSFGVWTQRSRSHLVEFFFGQDVAEHGEPSLSEAAGGLLDVFHLHTRLLAAHCDLARRFRGGRNNPNLPVGFSEEAHGHSAIQRVRSEKSIELFHEGRASQPSNACWSRRLRSGTQVGKVLLAAHGLAAAWRNLKSWNKR